MRGFEPMTLANMRANGVRSVIAACANCGRSADVLAVVRRIVFALGSS